jgi:CubicO group peptidase (beta-lactamase class C family)
LTEIVKYSFSKNPFIFIWLLLICISCGHNTTDENNYLSLENKLQELIIDGELIGAEVLIIENQKETFHKSVGWADKDSNKKLENESIWTIMSMTKPFTATAILMLVEDEKLSLDDSITKYFPNFKGNPQVTIRQLLEQSSGDDGNHGDGGHNVTEFETLDDWINDWAMQESSGTFGEFAYSNFNYGALAYIIEQVSGKPIETFLTERIIIPLNLQHTFVKFSTDQNWINDVPSRYQLNDSINKFEKFWSNDQPPSWKFLSGALGLWMSAKDYAVFMQMWLNKGKYGNLVLLKESTINEALKIHINAYGEELFGHGYGWFIEEEPLIFRYGGSAGGFAKACISKNSIVIYLTHCSGGKHKSKFEDELDRIWFPNQN